MSEAGLEQIRSLKEKIINRCKELGIKIQSKMESVNRVSTILYKELVERTVSSSQYFTKLSNDLDNYNNHINENYEILDDLEIEKSLIQNIIDKKEQQLNRNESYINMLKNNIATIDYLLMKENDNLENLKHESDNSDKKDNILLFDFTSLLNYYKSFSCFAFEKTNNGNFKIVFKNVKSENNEAYVILSVIGKKYEVIEVFPKISHEKHSEDLKKTHNLNEFLAKIMREFLICCNK